ncbi:hypothetical protein B5P45_03315 [Phyllobacterium zundukense]|uniref:Uncharacterized protein n=2 Tax=Phyllobacterium zundukense TaxID=1867719 RepID=A0A2N9W3C2_9HYPH|nr:hypothetical protein BLM14_08765 [Phyllobacterium zundukense]PIO46240.1 hypothetical protein B5P45_03315 [Phyllobacterium zundukense]
MEHAMNDKDENPKTVKVMREQLNQPAYLDALHSRYRPVQNDKLFKDLLKRMHDKEPDTRN